MSTSTNNMDLFFRAMNRQFPDTNLNFQRFLDILQNEFNQTIRAERTEHIPSRNNPVHGTHTQPSHTGTNSNTRPSSLDEQIRRNQHNIQDIIDDYNYNMVRYNRNMEQWLVRYNDNFYQYQRNTEQIIHMLHDFQSYATQNNVRHNSRNTRTGQRYSTRNTANPINWTTFIPLRYNSTRNGDLRLTQTQIDISTETIEYTDNILEERCPITWEDFTIGEDICRIKGCGHVFKPSSLMNWLRTNSHCPVCRYDLRNYREPVVGESDVSLNSVDVVNQPVHQNPYNQLNTPIDVETIYTTSFDINQHSLDNLDAILESVMQQIGNDIVLSFDTSNNTLHTSI